MSDGELIPNWLRYEVYKIEHHPNCASKYLVRLRHPDRGEIHGDARDVCGYGVSIIEAAEKAQITRDLLNLSRRAKMLNMRIETNILEGHLDDVFFGLEYSRDGTLWQPMIGPLYTNRTDLNGYLDRENFREKAARGDRYRVTPWIRQPNKSEEL
jgi:hypothetical protein